jgi:sugar lactone lactonase YvrE
MKILTLCSITFCSLVFASCVAEEPPYPVVWEVTEDVSSPESAYFDADSGFVFVSNIGEGGPAEKDGTGYLSKFSADGKVVAARWITGLDAPKGLRSHAGRLWVSDIDQLVEIDIAEGRIVRRIDVPGAQFLNDVACDAEGTVYVSDTFGTKIYRVREDRVEVFAEGEELEYPNGLLVVDDALLVAAWGRPEEDFSTKVPGRLFALDLNTARKSLITPEPLGNLDGLERVAAGRYLVSDWNSGKILYVTPTGDARLVMQLPKGAADIGYIPDQRLLIVPQMTENRVTAFRLTEPERSKTSGR